MLCCNSCQVCVIKNTGYRYVNGLWGNKRKLDHSLIIVNTENRNSYILKFKDLTGQHWHVTLICPSHKSVEMRLLIYWSQLCSSLKMRFQKAIPLPKSPLHVHTQGKVSTAQASQTMLRWKSGLRFPSQWAFKYWLWQAGAGWHTEGALRGCFPLHHFKEVWIFNLFSKSRYTVNIEMWVLC